MNDVAEIVVTDMYTHRHKASTITLRHMRRGLIRVKYNYLALPVIMTGHSRNGRSRGLLAGHRALK
jgi:3-phenylpropionate/cinnamic acid dioxygenase small subunit